MKGLIHIYCGDGKGKTTAAIGLAARAAGNGMKVAILQFLKGQETGELSSLALIPGITVIRGKASEKFTFQMDERELQQTYDLCTKNLLTALELLRAGQCDLLVLDEILGALSCELVDEDLLRSLIEQKPEQAELVLTGRNPPDWLLEKADYVTEMVKRKHPYDRGVPARRGIEL
ncbi:MULTISPECIES: cob(I)yrinic acid a,c-diamide adenosyltransferase [Anaerotruncus]|jgi:cob(I)alamin adenosyltransferase|uniref:cob(I)yrinic acid a,c-diamide adenosyltransferase n=1 Tax=Anaerotruncus TaxID=244127 RepID=UPI00082D98FA|nr:MULTISPECIES: cob(I)yrinic acid a,c-diamide adenosyltransferase [Anaerotruncus]RGX55988.1 cob(I)yrinic acid a,c-diamide adenosyltransferase [Anaerotruncus sp. AF02-27]